ncbi:hypothetical protein SKAU_G00210460 [Synaphobranchus kaupii]|uniref:Uncharacterized protein n=1 Tax=Synaphobranchus kaupii TaxID=118154 RepID=A0A9Q1IUI4_SYNKA|nr:hypothetical protein SKAU_G00210460 [Synaphobranchus kaupii]
MAEAQTAQARVYNRGAQPREFAPGDKVLVLVPTSECKFLAKWNGPYEVIEKMGTINYRVAVKTESVQVPMGEQLTPSQQQDLQDLVNRNRDVFSAEAGHTDLIQHRIVTEPGKRVKLRPYRIPEARREAIAAEMRERYCSISYVNHTWIMDRTSGASAPGPRAARGPPSLRLRAVRGPRLPKEVERQGPQCALRKLTTRPLGAYCVS